MTEQNYILEEIVTRSIKLKLLADGWQTSRRGSANYERPEDRPGVYVILVLRNDLNNLVTYGHDEILYVGSSSNIASRISGHEVFRVANALLKEDLLSIWFKYCDKPTREEKRLIRLYKPALNTIHNA